MYTFLMIARKMYVYFVYVQALDGHGSSTSNLPVTSYHSDY